MKAFWPAACNILFHLAADEDNSNNDEPASDNHEQQPLPSGSGNQTVRPKQVKDLSMAAINRKLKEEQLKQAMKQNELLDEKILEKRANIRFIEACVKMRHYKKISLNNVCNAFFSKIYV